MSNCPLKSLMPSKCLELPVAIYGRPSMYLKKIHGTKEFYRPFIIARENTDHCRCLTTGHTLVDEIDHLFLWISIPTKFYPVQTPRNLKADRRTTKR